MTIKQPILTEKSIKLYEDMHKVTFEVTLDATKHSASRDLANAFGVTVKKAWVTNRLGKTKRNPRTGRQMKRSSDKKIMVFQIGEKDSLDIFKGA